MPNLDNISFDFRKRTYCHFDPRIDKKRACDLVSNPNKVAQHAFFPFIRRRDSIPRYKPEEHRVKLKDRFIAYASHYDAAIYEYYSSLLSQSYEQKLAELNIANIPTAYRKSAGKCNIHYAKEAFDFLSSNCPCKVYCYDITKFFDNIDHSILYKEWCKLLGNTRLPNDHFAVFKSLTKFDYVSEVELYARLRLSRPEIRKQKLTRLCDAHTFRTKIRGIAPKIIDKNSKTFGIPQGSPMSGLLSNIYMIPFDQELRRVEEQFGCFARRYSDDIIIVVPEEFGDEADAIVQLALIDQRLEIQEEKIEIYPCTVGKFDHPVQYLGLTFDGINIRIRQKAFGRYHSKVRSYLRRSIWAAQHNKQNNKPFRRRLHELYTHYGSKNFISYAHRCSKICESESVRLQVARHFKKLNKAVIGVEASMTRRREARTRRWRENRST